MITFLVIGGVVVATGLFVWASRNPASSYASSPAPTQRVLAGLVDPAAYDDVEFDEDTLPYSYLWRST